MSFFVKTVSRNNNKDFSNNSSLNPNTNRQLFENNKKSLKNHPEDELFGGINRREFLRDEHITGSKIERGTNQFSFQNFEDQRDAAGTIKTSGTYGKQNLSVRRNPLDSFNNEWLENQSDHVVQEQPAQNTNQRANQRAKTDKQRN